MCYLQRIYYISDDLIYFRQCKRTLEKLSLEPPKASCTLFPQRVLSFAKKEIPKEQQSARWGKRIQKGLKWIHTICFANSVGFWLRQNSLRGETALPFTPQVLLRKT